MSDEADSYLTIERDAEVETKVKGSRFIGRAFAVVSRENAEEILAGLRKKEYDATHHCFGYIIRAENSDGTLENTQDRNIFRYSDDCEPNGSAGKPIYDQILGRELVDTLVVVTRYFGGTKLGVGGLVRAYSESAALTLDESGVSRRYHYQTIRLQTDFSHYQLLLNLLNSLDGLVEDSQFSDTVSLTVKIRISRVDKFVATFTELTHGKGMLERVTE